jgi:hypothetical protein
VFDCVRSLGKPAPVVSKSPIFREGQISGEKSGFLEAIRPQALQSRGRHSEMLEALDLWRVRVKAVPNPRVT